MKPANRLWIVLAAVIVSSAVATDTRGDANELFKKLSNATAINERRQICEDLDAQEVPVYAALVCRGFLMLAAREDSIAVLFLEDALLREPNLAIGCVMYADTYFERGDLEEAERWYNRAREIAPDRLDPHYGLGLIWLKRAETEGAPAYEKALESLREMTRIEPNDPDGWGNVGMVLATLERFDEAEKSYRKALKLAPNDPQIHYSLGSLASLRGDNEEAEKSWKKALSIDPAYALAVTELAALNGRLGRIDSAIQILRDGVEAAHVGPPAGRLRRDLGLLHILAEEPDEAADLLEQARVLTPDARTLCALAHLRMTQGSVVAALAHLVDAAVDDSAAVVPFVHAWSAELSQALDGFRSENVRGERNVRQIASSVGTAGGLKGVAATHSLVSSLLPDWQLPEGKLVMEEPPSLVPYDTAPVPVYRAIAEYPEAAGGIGGSVTVLVHVNEYGIVRDAEVLSKGGNPALEWAALDAAKRWRFEPAKLKGESVPASVTIPFRFSGSR